MQLIFIVFSFSDQYWISNVKRNVKYCEIVELFIKLWRFKSGSRGGRCPKENKAMCWNKFWFLCRSDDFAWIHSGGNKKGRKNGLQGFLWFVIPFYNAIGVFFGL